MPHRTRGTDAAQTKEDRWERLWTDAKTGACFSAMRRGDVLGGSRPERPWVYRLRRPWRIILNVSANYFAVKERRLMACCGGKWPFEIPITRLVNRLVKRGLACHIRRGHRRRVRSGNRVRAESGQAVCVATVEIFGMLRSSERRYTKVPKISRDGASRGS